MRRFVGLVLCAALAVTSCTGGGAENPQADDENPCRVADSSNEERLLRALLGGGSVETIVYNTPMDVGARLRKNLLGSGGAKATPYVYGCSFAQDSRLDDGEIRLGFSWVSRDDPYEKEKSPSPSRRFDVSGTLGESGGNYSKLYLRCDLPGDLGPPSERVLLRARASNTSNSEQKGSEEAMKQHLAFLYLMTQRVTAALACENKPLQGDPVVKPVKG
ncbi:hypothetical protein [Streptomyces roseolilacinus]|uniref:Lipoprotein n=1 Tax=Streptomyces roseolilacinus TaxID=66904 RepID=A0A918B5D1_9ACTN|nr:hypothetical protein [Streptomyces roseolilacinus]GGQ30598.1 hypothetical protein GCM10010249_56670 [Streptomyces roseolilacinus]